MSTFSKLIQKIDEEVVQTAARLGHGVANINLGAANIGNGLGGEDETAYSRVRKFTDQLRTEQISVKNLKNAVKNPR